MTAKDLGPLTWNVPIVDATGKPSPEFQRRWETQRANNSLIGSITLGSGAPTGTPKDGAEYIDISTTPYTLYVGSGGSWHKVGVVKFTDLADAPHTYSGDGGRIVKVNLGETGIEFLASGVDGEVLTSKGAGADPIWQGLAGFTFACSGPVPPNTLVGACSWTKTLTFHNADLNNSGTALVRPAADYRFRILDNSLTQVGYIDVTTAGVWSVVWVTDPTVWPAGTIMQILTQITADASLAGVSARIVGYF